MKSRDFCYWLQGFFELGGYPPSGLTQDQKQMANSISKGKRSLAAAEQFKKEWSGE